MKEQILKMKESAMIEISETADLKQLDEIRVKYLGKKGELTSILRGMGALSPEERPVIGELVNKLRDEIESVIEEKEEKLTKDAILAEMKREKIDVTMPSKKQPLGSIHPITKVINEVKEIFIGLRI
jgi:phenylalanyl-tRNA synthetase alpha chain